MHVLARQQVYCLEIRGSSPGGRVRSAAGLPLEHRPQIFSRLNHVRQDHVNQANWVCSHEVVRNHHLQMYIECEPLVSRAGPS